MAIKDNIGAWRKLEEVNAKNTRRSIASSIRSRASIIAPVGESGNLHRNGRVEDTSSDTTTIIFGDELVPYARRRNFENKKNPQTKDYLKRAGDQVAKEVDKRFIK